MWAGKEVRSEVCDLGAVVRVMLPNGTTVGDSGGSLPAAIGSERQ
jgi:hypothetical protein